MASRVVLNVVILMGTNTQLHTKILPHTKIQNTKMSQFLKEISLPPSNFHLLPRGASMYICEMIIYRFFMMYSIFATISAASSGLVVS